MLPPEPAMFGRELTEQVRADSKFNEKMVPLIVEKCIAAVEGSCEPLLLTGIASMDIELIPHSTGLRGYLSQERRRRPVQVDHAALRTRRLLGI
jgi:hypothetical protein